MDTVDTVDTVDTGDTVDTVDTYKFWFVSSCCHSFYLSFFSVPFVDCWLLLKILKENKNLSNSVLIETLCSNLSTKNSIPNAVYDKKVGLRCRSLDRSGREGLEGLP